MWNKIFAAFLVCSVCQGDVSHLKHPGYPQHTPDNPLQLPSGSSDSSVSGYPKIVPDNPLQIPDASTGNVQNQLPDSHGEGSSDGGSFSVQQDQGHHHHHHNHGEDGKYNPHDDGTGWDIRKSVPGEPGQDYPTYDSVPSTSFTCKEKVPGYYADEEASCQVFRICTVNSLKTHNSFLCPNGSLFNQRFLTCDWWMNVDCTASSEFYYKNEEIGKMPTGQDLMYEVNKMLEAPNKNPYYYTDQQMKYVDHMIQDNQIQGTGPIHDIYLPVKPSTTTTTKKYTPTTTTPTTTTTTTTTTASPIITETNINRVQTEIPKVPNQQTIIKVETMTPSPQTVNENTLSNVQTQQDFQVGAKFQNNGLHVSQVTKTPNLHESQIYPILHLPKLNQPPSSYESLNIVSQNAQKQQNRNLFISPIVSTVNKPSKTDGQLYISQLNPINNQQQLSIQNIQNIQNDNQLFESSIVSTVNNPSKTDGQLYTSQLKPIANPQQLSARNNKQLFESPIVSTVNNPSKTDGQLYTSQLKPIVNPQQLSARNNNQLFESPIVSTVNKPSTPDGQLYISQSKPLNSPQRLSANNNNQLFESPIVSTVNKPSTPDGQLYILQLKPLINPQQLSARNNNQLFESPIVSTVNNLSRTDGQLYTSQLKPIVNPQQLSERNNNQLFESPIISTVNNPSKTDGQLYTSQLKPIVNPQQLSARNNNQLFESPIVSTVNNPSKTDGQLYTSQLKPILNPQQLSARNNNQLFVSPIVSTINQPSKTDGQLYTSQLKPILNPQQLSARNNNQLFESPIVSTVNNPSKTDGQLYTSQLKPIVNPQQLSTRNNNQLFVSPIVSTVNNPSKTDGQLHTSQIKPPDNLQQLPAKESNQLFTSPIKTVNSPQLLHLSQAAMKNSDNKLYTSQLKPPNNVQKSLHTSQINPNQNPKPFSPIASNTDGKVFTSPERPAGTNINNTVFTSSVSSPKPFKSTNKDQFLSQVNLTSTSGLSGIDRSKIDQATLTGIDYSLPKPSSIDQSTKTGVDYTYPKPPPRIDQSTDGGVGYNYPKQPPSTTIDQKVTNQNQNQQTPSLTVTNEKTQTVTHSEKTTHFFQNTNDEPEKISLFGADQSGNKQVVQPVNQQQGIQQHTFTGVQQPQGFDQSNKQQHGVTGGQQQFGIGQTGGSQIQQQTFLGVQQPQGFGQSGGSNIQQQFGQPIPPNIQQFGQSGVTGGQQQFGLDQSRGSNIQQQIGNQGRQQIPVYQTGIRDFTKEQAFKQIDNIQQQELKQNFGKDVLNPRISNENIAVPDFGAHYQGGNIGYQLPQGFSHQGSQHNLFGAQNFPTGGYVETQEYQYQQPNFHEQNLQNFNYHGQNNGPNFNIQLDKNGQTNNYKGESLSQFQNGQTHSSYSGHGVAYKESTNVDIVPALGFHLNDNNEKNSYISAVLRGLINDGPSYEESASNQFGQSQFLPNDARFSSYNGPSSYLVPQSSVQNLPSDSGYYR